MAEVTIEDLKRLVPSDSKKRKPLKTVGSVFNLGKTETRECPTHGEYASSLLPTGEWLRCSLCIAEETRREDMGKQVVERQALKANVSQKNLEKLRIQSQIPRRFQNRSFDNYVVEADPQARALKISQAYVSRFDDRYENGGGLVFSGRPGTGKTHLACAVGNALLEQGWNVLFTPVYDLLDAVKEMAFDLKECSERAAIRRFTEMDLLILDELGAEKGTDWERQTLFKVINNRYNEGRPTIILTNLNLDEFKEFVGDRIYERMEEGSGAFLAFNWSSYRKNIRTIAGVA
jgi:DNA replication protein DnaC